MFIPTHLSLDFGVKTISGCKLPFAIGFDHQKPDRLWSDEGVKNAIRCERRRQRPELRSCLTLKSFAQVLAVIQFFDALEVIF